MKKTLRLLLCMAVLSFAACGNDKKKSEEKVLIPKDTSAFPSTDSMPRDRTQVNPDPPADSVTLDNSKVEQPRDTVNEYLYKGLMVYRDNVGEFIDCSNQRVYYINDRTNELRGKYYSFDLPNNAPLYVEVVGTYVNPDAKSPKKYKRQMNISHLNVMDRDVPFHCGGALAKAKAGKAN